jgi:hypothetical protein
MRCPLARCFVNEKERGLLLLVCIATPSPSTMSSKQKLVLSIIDFLNKSIQDGTVKQDDREGLEVAS